MLGITIGDPAGIGPEIVVAALWALPAEALGKLVIFGDTGVLDRAARAMGLGSLSGRVAIEPVTSLAPDQAPFGKPDAHGGDAQVAYLQAAMKARRAGRIAGLVTAPINKTWARRATAGFAFPGHTEFLAEATGAHRVVMAFVGPRFKVALATIHHALAEVPQVLDETRVLNAIELGAELCQRLGIASPRIGVLGLNPHAGEGGLFGTEETRIIAPAIATARQRGLTVSDPLVPDAAYRADHDLFVAQYHDQALIPVKLVDFELAVNVTLGLPGLVRTSPDHGTAYDLAGQGKARHASFAAALDLAQKMLPR